MIWTTLLWALGIFLSRLVDVGLGTLRVQMIVRRRKYLAAAIGFVEILIYILVVSRVIADIGNWRGWESVLNVVAYAAGFATGTLAGIAISERAGRGVLEVTIISREPAEQIEQPLRQAGFALTRHEGVGREGHVDVLVAVCRARELPRLLDAVTEADPRAFIYTHELAGLRGGHIYGVKSKL